MRFPRTAKIFRGQLDMAPLAGIFFLLIIFLLLASLVYTPGIKIQLSDENLSDANGSQKIILIARNGEIFYEKQTYNLGTLEALRSELKKLPAQSLVVLRVDPTAPREISGRLREITREINLTTEMRGTGIELPESENAMGTANPTVFVAVNLGQFFYENRLVREDELGKKLAEAAKRSKELTLVVMADKATQIDVINRLKDLARNAGIKEMRLQTRPRPFGKIVSP